jgi:hypothetical protein
MLGEIIAETLVRIFHLVRRVPLDVLEEAGRDCATLEALLAAEIAILLFGNGSVRIEGTGHVRAHAERLLHQDGLLKWPRLLDRLKLRY